MASVRPPSLPPTVATASFTQPRIFLLHPGYPGFDNILFALPAVDGTQSTPGLHHRTVLTAGAIIANNAFDCAYLTRDQAGRDRVDATVSLDGLLEPDNYWLQLGGHEVRVEGGDANARDEASSMPPPGPQPPPLVPDTDIQNSTSPSSHVLPVQRTYPLVPCFGDWQFPHDKLPLEWKQRHPAPPMPLPSASTSPRPTPSAPSRRCYITGYLMGINDCHLVPRSQENWWAKNGMRRYTKAVPGLISDKANLALFRADIHALFDNHYFAIVPKPLDQSPTPSSYAFAAHVLKDDETAREFCDLHYHNVGIPQSAVDTLSPEFLFARFAWAIFWHLQAFFETPTRRHIALTTRNEAGQNETDLRWLNGKELTSYLATWAVTRSGSRSRKRSSSQMTQNDEDFDVYQERWARRRDGMDSSDSSDTSLDNLDAETRRIRENTRWYHKVGQYCGARDPEEERIKESTRWYEEVGQYCGSRDREDDYVKETTRWYEENCEPSCSSSTGDQYQQEPSNRDAEDGRFRIEQPTQLTSPGLEGVPPLSRSFTTSGSNRSSAFLDASVNEDKVDVVDAVSSGDKIIGVDDALRHDQHDSLEDGNNPQPLREL